MGKSYKYKRSRKAIGTDTLKLRIQDALNAIEPVFLGKEGTDYSEKEMQLMLKAAHAYSQLASKYRKLVETDEILERIEALEQQTENTKL